MQLIDIGFLKQEKNDENLWEKILEDLHLILKEIP